MQMLVLIRNWPLRFRQGTRGQQLQESVAAKESLPTRKMAAAAKASLLDTTRDGRFEIDRTPGMGNWSGFLTPNGRLDTRARGFTQQTVNLQFKFGDWCPTEHEAGGGGTH